MSSQLATTASQLRLAQEESGELRLLFRTYEGILQHERNLEKTMERLRLIERALAPLVERETRTRIDAHTKVVLATQAYKEARQALRTLGESLEAFEAERELFIEMLQVELSSPDGEQMIH